MLVNHLIPRIGAVVLDNTSVDSLIPAVILIMSPQDKNIVGIAAPTKILVVNPITSRLVPVDHLIPRINAVILDSAAIQPFVPGVGLILPHAMRGVPAIALPTEVLIIDLGCSVIPVGKRPPPANRGAMPASSPTHLRRSRRRDVDRRNRYPRGGGKGGRDGTRQK